MENFLINAYTEAIDENGNVVCIINEFNESVEIINSDLFEITNYSYPIYKDKNIKIYDNREDNNRLIYNYRYENCLGTNTYFIETKLRIDKEKYGWEEMGRGHVWDSEEAIAAINKRWNSKPHSRRKYKRLVLQSGTEFGVRWNVILKLDSYENIDVIFNIF
jgi:hypothetical protein